MYRKFVSVMYVANIFFSSMFSLLFPMCLCLGLGWLCHTKWGVGGWIYVPLTVLGAILGLLSMVKYIMTASRSLEQIEKEHKEKEALEKERKKEEG